MASFSRWYAYSSCPRAALSAAGPVCPLAGRPAGAVVRAPRFAPASDPVLAMGLLLTLPGVSDGKRGASSRHHTTQPAPISPSPISVQTTAQTHRSDTPPSRGRNVMVIAILSGWQD